MISPFTIFALFFCEFYYNSHLDDHAIFYQNLKYYKALFVTNANGASGSSFTDLSAIISDLGFSEYDYSSGIRQLNTSMYSAVTAIQAKKYFDDRYQSMSKDLMNNIACLSSIPKKPLNSLPCLQLSAQSA
jgi:hypothetical protein